MSKRAETPEWLRVAEEFEASGQTQREFAGRQGLRLSTLQSWVYRRRRQVGAGAEPPVRLLPVQLSRMPASDAAWLEVTAFVSRRGDRGAITLVVPPAGEGPYMEGLYVDGRKAELSWRSTYRWHFNAGSTPAELNVGAAEDKLRATASNITGGQNDGGLNDAIRASHQYEGRTSRGVDDGTGSRDGVNVVGFGDLAAGTLAVTCTWYNLDTTGRSGAPPRK